MKHYRRQCSKELCISVVDKIYVHRAPNVLAVLDLLDWIENACFNSWYVEFYEHEIEFGFIDSIDNLLYCKKWGTVL